MIKGEWLISDRDGLAKIFKSLAYFIAQNAGKSLEITARVYTKKRTINQNKALFGHAYKIIRKETRDPVNDIHFDMCGEYFGWAVKHFRQKTIRIPVRTTTTDEEGKDGKISTKDFADMFEFVQDYWLQHRGIVIPDPDKNWKQKVNEAKSKELAKQQRSEDLI